MTETIITQGNIVWISLGVVIFIVLMGIISHLNQRKYNKKLEMALLEAEKATKVKESLLTNISHEIRTPMNAIKGFTQILLQSKLSDRQFETLSKIDNASTFLQHLVNDILDFSKIKEGKIELESIDFNINTVLEQVSDIVGIRANTKDVELIFNIEKDVPVNLIGDPFRLTQVLVNLMDNGVKFTDHGEVVLTIKALSPDRYTTTVQFEVADTGIGLKEEQLAKLFDSYAQADSSISRKYGGTGLGLSISSKFVEMMGGEITVESVYREGSRFTFSIALPTVQENEKRSYRLPSKELMDKNVLIIDNENRSSEALTNMLKYFHYHSTLAGNSTELRELLSNKKFDIIIIDEKMVRLCRDKSIAHRCTAKMVLLSSLYHEEKPFRELKIDDYLSKPFNQQMLYNIILNLFDNKGLTRRIKKMHYKHEDLFVLKGSKILLAEDNIMNQKVILGLLEDTGIEVTTVTNGQKAVAKIMADDSYEMILMDINMPVMDGYNATDIIREYRQFDHIPIIAVSANVMRDNQDKIRGLGMQDSLNKPIDVEQLYELLLRYIPKKLDPSEVRKTPGLKADTGDRERLKSVLQGMKVDEALDRLNGNTKLYQSILFDFVDSLNSSMDDFQKYFDAENFKETKRFAHYYKGIAGNLGANELYELFKALEDAFSNLDKHHTHELVKQLNEKKSALLEAVNALKKSKSEKSKEVVEDIKVIDDVSKIGVNALLHQLIEAVKTGDAVVCKKLTSQLEGYSLAAEKMEIVEKIGHSVKHYNFKATVVYINELLLLDKR